MPRRENLQVRISARDEASRVLQRAQDRVLNVNTASKASFRETGNVAEQTFTRIQQDVQLATADYERGIISLQEYTQALRFARREALELKSGGLQPVGAELKAFNSVVKATGGAASKGVRGTGDLRRSMASLAAVSAGLPGRLGTVASTLSGFAFSSLATAGVFAGLAAVGLAFKTIRDRAKEAGEETEEAINTLIENSDALRRLQEQITETRGVTGARQELLDKLVLLRKGGRRAQGAGGPGSSIFVPLTPEERTELQKRIVLLAGALQENTESNREEARARQEFEQLIGQRPETPDLGAPGTLDRLLFERIGGPDFQQRATKFGRWVTVSPLAGAGRALEPRAGRAPGLLPEGTPEFGLERERMLEDLKIIGPLEGLGEGLEEASDGVLREGRGLVVGLGQVSTALAGIITGKRSPVGGLGSAAFGLSGLFKAGSSAALGFGIGGIALGFVDALTSSRTNKAREDAHLNALRRHEAEKAPATIILRVPGSDPRSAEYQRLVDETRREAEARGFRVTVERG